MSKRDYEYGSSKVEDFFAFINERHSIYLARKQDMKKPWTDDKILQQYKFTNVFRELDRGTVALRKYLWPRVQGVSEYSKDDLEMIFWHVCWYRLFNEVSNLTDWSTLPADPMELQYRLNAKYHRDEKIFTSAHMTTGVSGESKLVTYMRAVMDAWDHREELTFKIMRDETLEAAYSHVIRLYMMGPFVTYEVVTDLRWTPLLRQAPDKLTWANVGPGAKRGMERLGMEPTVESMVSLHEMGLDYLSCSLMDHYVDASDAFTWLDGKNYPPFELREIEHCLCEFDKYERARTEVGRPRQKYNGLS